MDKGSLVIGRALGENDDMSLIELKGIERVFQLGDATVHALAGLNLRIDNGEYLAVMGPSGSGKSTLLNLLGLLDRPNSGTYLLEGREVTTLSPDEQARVRSERIGFVFQSFHLVPRLTAAENIALPMMLDRKTDAVTAALASLFACARNPGPMLLWATCIAILAAIGFTTLFLGLIVTMPLVGHASWHVYREVVADEEKNEQIDPR